MKILILSEDNREPGKGGGAESLMRDLTLGMHNRGHEVGWWFGDEPLAKAVDTFKPDIVQVHTVHNRFGLQPALYLQRHGIPHVWVMMDYWPLCSGRMLLQKRQQASCPAVTGACDPDCELEQVPAQYLETVNRSPVVALNSNTAAIYNRNGIRVTATIGCGVDTDYFKPAPDKREPGKIITTSAWPEYPTKGLHVLKAASCQAGVNVHVVAHVPRERVRDALQTASIFVFPSTYEETWGLCLTEAMATGLACVASNVCGPRAQISDGVTGLLFENRNADELADKLQWLLADPEHQKLLGEQARAWVEQNATLDIMASKYERLYKAVIG